MNGRLKLGLINCALALMCWTSNALGEGISSSYTPRGKYYGAIVPIVTTVGNTIFSKITFEGVGNNQSINTIAGVDFSPNCSGLVDADVPGEPANSGQFANEPSPSTIAYFLTDGGCTVTFPEPVTGVSLFYTSSVPVTLKAFNGATQVASTIGAATPLGEVGGDPNGQFDKWLPLEVNVGTNSITSVQILGVNNQTGFDDFTFATTTFLEPFEPVSTEVVSQAGDCTVTRILGERDRTEQILTGDSGCDPTGPLGLTLQGDDDPEPIPVTGLFVSPNSQITTVVNPTLFCWPSTTTGKVTCVKKP